MKFYVAPLGGLDHGLGWTATVQGKRWFMALRSPRYPFMFSERCGGTHVLVRLFGWRLVWKWKRPPT